MDAGLSVTKQTILLGGVSRNSPLVAWQGALVVKERKVCQRGRIYDLRVIKKG